MTTCRKQIVGKYELGKVLASGYFDCRTRICTHIVTGAQYVVRIYSKAVLAEAQWIWDRTREAIHVMRTLPKHDNIIETTECFETETSLYILMQLFAPMQITRLYTTETASGQPVTISLEKTKHYYTQVVRGLLHMHSHNVVHLGLAPDHVMVNDRDQVKIGYLVSCMYFPKGKLCNEIRGTTHTVAPEVLNNTEYDPYVADAWSMGVLLYFMLHQGRYPHDSANTTKNIKYHRIRAPDSRLSDDAKDILAWLLHPVPARRMRVEQILSHPFFTSEEGSTTEVTEYSSSRRLTTSTVETHCTRDLVTGQNTLNIRIPYGLTRQEEAAYIIQQTYRAYRLNKQRRLSPNCRFSLPPLSQGRQSGAHAPPPANSSARPSQKSFLVPEKNEGLMAFLAEKRSNSATSQSFSGIPECVKTNPRTTLTTEHSLDGDTSFAMIIKNSDKEEMSVTPQISERSYVEPNARYSMRLFAHKLADAISFTKTSSFCTKEGASSAQSGALTDIMRLEPETRASEADVGLSAFCLPKIKVDATRPCPICHRLPAQRLGGSEPYAKTRFVYKNGEFTMRSTEELEK